MEGWKGRRTDGRTVGQKDGQTLFYKTLPATAAGSIRSFKSCTKNESSRQNSKIATYSSSQVDKATEFCFLEHQLIAGPNSDRQKQ